MNNWALVSIIWGYFDIASRHQLSISWKKDNSIIFYDTACFTLNWHLLQLKFFNLTLRALWLITSKRENLIEFFILFNHIGRSLLRYQFSLIALNSKIIAVMNINFTAETTSKKLISFGAKERKCRARSTLVLSGSHFRLAYSSTLCQQKIQFAEWNGGVRSPRVQNPVISFLNLATPN